MAGIWTTAATLSPTTHELLGPRHDVAVLACRLSWVEVACFGIAGMLLLVLGWSSSDDEDGPAAGHAAERGETP